MTRRLKSCTQKLTDEHKMFAMQQFACDVKAVDVATKIKDNYGVEITPNRLIHIKNYNKRWSEIYNKLRQQYLAKVGSLVDIPIANKRHRLQVIQTLLEECLVDPELNASKKDKVETALKALKAAKDEVNEASVNREKHNSLLQYVEKQSIVVNPKDERQVIEVKPVGESDEGTKTQSE